MALLPPSSRRARRQMLRRRTPQWRSFSQCWRRTLPTVLVASLLPISLVPRAHAVSGGPSSTAYYQVGADGNYSTAGSFHDAPSGGGTVVPDGKNGIFYTVINTTGNAITHDHSTGTNGVDTISSLDTNGSFFLTGGTLSGISRSSSFNISGSSVFQISNGATLRSFTVTGKPLSVSGSATLDNVVTNINGLVQGALTFANSTLATVMNGNTLTLGGYNSGAASLSGSGTLILAGGSLNVGQFDPGAVGAGQTVTGTGAVQGETTSASLTNNGTIQAVGGTLTVQNLGSVTNNALMQATSGSILAITSSTTNLGTINAADGGTVAFSNMNLTGNAVDGMGNITATGALTSTGTGVVNLSGDNTTNVTTSGQINIVNGRTNAFGTLTNNGTFTVGMGNTLGLGSYNDGAINLAGTGTLSLTGGSLNVGQFDTGTIGAGQTVTGTGAVQGDTTSASLVNQGTIQASGGALTVGSLGGFTSNGALRAVSGGTLDVATPTSGSGTVFTDKGSAINFNGGSSLNQQGGTSQVDGAVTLNGTFTISSGTLKGTGTVNGNVINSGGTVAPGDSPGTLTVNGNYMQNGTGALAIEFTNTAHDLLMVTGAAVTGGTVSFSFLDTFLAPGTTGQTFDFLTSTGLSTSLPGGLFFANETTDPSGLSNGFVTEAGAGGGVYRIARDPANANAPQVTVIAATPAAAPEPSQYAAFGVGLLGLAALALRARKRALA